jgi:hypothetical protein
MNGLAARLDSIDLAERTGRPDGALLAQFAASGVRFASSTPRVEERFYQAVGELFACIRPLAGLPPVLNEGGIYLGCWLESTGTINTEILSRFMPQVAADTLSGFAIHQRDDGLLPYKLTADGPVFAQIQTVTPLARTVWTHHRLNGAAPRWLESLYAAMAGNDDWLARRRDTRGTGAVEAFCAYDTGHDLSARFWHIPDSPYRNDPGAYDPTNPLLPLIAPDLTANVACQRRYLGRIAAEIGADDPGWDARAAASEAALFEHCFDQEDSFFYDRDALGRLVRLQSDVLLRVLACEIGDDALFATALERYLLNSRKFFAKYPLTSIALDDPRFNPAFDHNSWCGPTNMLTVLRTPHAFEHHGRHVELSWMLQPVLNALVRAERFAQTLDPFTGRAGFTEVYSPAILSLIDIVERLCGILPRPDGTLWFTGLLPAQIEHRDAVHETAYRRLVDGQDFRLVNADGRAVGLRDGETLFDAPLGLRVVTDRGGRLRAVVGMRAQPVEARIVVGDKTHEITVGPNAVWAMKEETFVRAASPGLTPPSA